MSLSLYVGALLSAHSYSASLRTDYVRSVLPGAEVESLRGGDVLCAVVQTPEDLVLVFRGTRPTDVRSVRRNFLCELTTEDFYRVHRGFAEGLNTIWLQVLQRINSGQQDGPRRLHLIGHSQGGAFATLAAVRLLQIHLDNGLRLDTPAPVFPASVLTYGAPRVGDSVFGDAVVTLANSACRVFRVRNCNDFVPDVPPYRWGYRHGFTETYLPAAGPPVEAPSVLWRLWDGLKERVRTRTLRDSLEAHRVESYVRKLEGVE